MEGKLELISRYDEYYLVKSISNEDISLDDILLHNESGRIISVNRFWESNGSKTIMDTGVRNPIELVISGNTFKKLIGYYSEYQKLPLSKLSLKNCQAIENGYDLMKLAEENSHKYYDVKTTDWHCNYNGFFSGFQKALEILGDKKFSEKQMWNIFYFGDSLKNQIKSGKIENKHMGEIFDEYIQSLQQTEWDVEVEMEQYVKYVPKSLATVYPTGGVRPKLDTDGCIILKRKL